MYIVYLSLYTSRRQKERKEQLKKVLRWRTLIKLLSKNCLKCNRWRRGRMPASLPLPPSLRHPSHPPSVHPSFSLFPSPTFSLHPLTFSFFIHLSLPILTASLFSNHPASFLSLFTVFPFPFPSLSPLFLYPPILLSSIPPSPLSLLFSSLPLLSSFPSSLFSPFSTVNKE